MDPIAQKQQETQEQIAQKQREMRQLEQQLETLNQQRIANLYPGRCFQYCLDHNLAPRAQLLATETATIRQMAEEHHFQAVARTQRWQAPHPDCSGWDGEKDTCECGGERFYWLYETVLPLDEGLIPHLPACVPASRKNTEGPLYPGTHDNADSPNLPV